MTAGADDFTVRREAEEAQALLAAIVASSSDAIVSKTMDGVITSWNAGAERLFGYSAAEAVGRPITLIIPPERHEEERSILERIRRGERVEAVETVRVSKEGSPLAVSLTVSPVIDRAGRIIGASKVARDIGARKQTEEARRLAEERLEAVLASIDDHLVCYDREWRYTYVNDHAARVLGKTREELLGRRIWDVFPEAVGNPYYRELHEAARERRVIRSEHYYAPFDRWFENHIYPTADGVTVFASDVTGRKRAEEAARAAKELLGLITDNLPALISYIDKDFRYRLNNRAYETWFGHARPEITGKYVWDVLGAAAWDKLRPHMEAALAGRTVSYEDEVPYKDAGTRWISATYIPHVGPEGAVEGFAVLVNDVSARRRDERELRRLNAELSEADRRKDEFLATLAHELRNPLAPIRNAVGILRLKDPADPALRAARDIIDRQVGQMTRLVDDLLEVSRITRGKVQLRRERVELAAAVQGAVEAARPLVEASAHDLTVTLPPEPVPLDADPTRLTQIFLNLLNNAAKYTPKGGHIRLTAGRQGGQVVVSVRDTGIGIPAEHMPRLFEMFSQMAPALERSEGGLGIGLALVRGLVELHGGSVEARSDGPGRGSEFLVRLPVAEVPAPAPAPVAASPQRAPPCRVLVADDNRDAADSLSLMLRLMGHDVRTAHDGQEAVRAAEAFRPDVALLDIGMPKLNGYEAARHIRKRPGGEAMTLIAVTGWGQDEDKRRATAAGFDHHLTKPVDPTSLEAVLRGVSP